MPCLPGTARYDSPLEQHAAMVRANAEASPASVFRCLASFPMYTIPLPVLLEMAVTRVQAGCTKTWTLAFPHRWSAAARLAKTLTLVIPANANICMFVERTFP